MPKIMIHTFRFFLPTAVTSFVVVLSMIGSIIFAKKINKTWRCKDEF